MQLIEQARHGFEAPANSSFPVSFPESFPPLTTLKTHSLGTGAGEGRTGRESGGKSRGTHLPENQSAGADVRSKRARLGARKEDAEMSCGRGGGES